jgi:DNA replication factor GINS
MGKLVKQASLAAAGMPDDENGLTAEEQDLYADLVDRIESNKAHVLDVIAGDAETAGSAGSTTESGVATTGSDARGESAADADAADSSAAAAMGGGLDGDAAPEPDAESSGDEPLSDAEPTPGEEPPAAVAEDLAEVKSESDDDDPTPDGGVRSESGDGGPSVDSDRVRVRVIDDVGEIFGVDERPYDLEAEDVVTLPAANAEPLVQKDAAEKLE